MPQLLSQFDLKPGVDRARFDAAWAAFVDQLIADDLAQSCGPMMERVPESGFDTDEERVHALIVPIVFRDHAQADAAWEAIEALIQPLGRFHAGVFGLVHDPVFTFWSES